MACHDAFTTATQLGPRLLTVSHTRNYTKADKEAMNGNNRHPKIDFIDESNKYLPIFFSQEAFELE